MMLSKTTILAVAVAVGLTAPVLAQGDRQPAGRDHGSRPGGMTMQHPTPAAQGAEAAPSTAGYLAAMERMMKDMPTITGNPDRDFALQMIPHHQAAIDMAKVLLAHGSDPAMRELANEVINAQEREIAVLRAFLAR